MARQIIPHYFVVLRCLPDGCVWALALIADLFRGVFAPIARGLIGVRNHRIRRDIQQLMSACKR